MKNNKGITNVTELKAYILDNKVVGQDFTDLINDCKEDDIELDLLWAVEYIAEVTKASNAAKEQRQRKFSSLSDEVRSYQAKQTQDLEQTLAAVLKTVECIVVKYQLELPTVEFTTEDADNGDLFKALSLLVSKSFRQRDAKEAAFNDAEAYHNYGKSKILSKQAADLSLDLNLDEELTVEDVVEPSGYTPEEIEAQRDLSTAF